MPGKNAKLAAKARQQKRADNGKFSKSGGKGGDKGARDPKAGVNDSERLRSWNGKGGMPAGWKDTATYKGARVYAKAKRTKMRTQKR